MSNNEQELFHPAPVWLTRNYLEIILRKYKKDPTLKIINLNIKPATAKGENYASVMTRVGVTYQTNNNNNNTTTSSYIVKTSHEGDPFVTSIMSKYQVFETEMLMYEKVLPKLNDLLREINDEDKLFAETIYVDYEHTAIIFEDLAMLNFGVADRLAGMNMEHTKLALKKLAKMHATASVLNDRESGILEHFDHGIMNRHTKGFSTFFEEMLLICGDYAENCPELGVYYKEKLKKLKDYVMEYGTRVFDKHDGFYHTLVHGDFWVNNVMLSYGNSGTDIRANNNGISSKMIKDLLLIDFQFCVWASPAVDLHYFLNTSLEGDLQLHHQEEFVQYYHGVLTDTLKKFQFKGYIPTLHEFCIQLEAGRFYAVTSTLVQQPMMINDNTEDADFQALMAKDERARNFRKMVYTNKNVQKYVKALLPIFDRHGLLDVNE